MIIYELPQTVDMDGIDIDHMRDDRLVMHDGADFEMDLSLRP